MKNTTLKTSKGNKKINTKKSAKKMAKVVSAKRTSKFNFSFNNPFLIIILVISALLASYFIYNTFAGSTVQSIWSSRARPNSTADNDNRPVEIGLKFRTAKNGYVNGVEFYKASTNTGQHTASLWDNKGNRLATANYSNESVSGWQKLNFASPVPILANTTYIVSYFAPVGHYSYSYEYFSNGPRSRLDLTALSGVYKYGGGFPIETYRSSNYWVDVLFSPNLTSTSNTPITSPKPTPPVVVVPSTSPEPTPTTSIPPTTNGTWPSGWNDPRFANNVSSSPRYNTGSTHATWQNLTVEDNSGRETFGYANYSLINSRIKAREGPRVSGSNILIDGCYIEVYGSGDDHADGIQAYEAGGAKNVVIRNTKVVLTTGALNAGIFFADHSSADLTLENVYVDGANAPNGAIWLPAVSGDLGVKNLIARHVRVKNSSGRQGLSLNPSPGLVNVIEWTDVAWEDGTPIPRPN